MKIWIDITNTPQVSVLLPIIKHLEKNHELYITARDFSETLPLLKQNGINPHVIGDYKGKSRYKKAFGLLSRLLDLYRKMPEFDLAISLGGNYTATIAWMRNKKSIVFSDNDISFKLPAYKLGSYFMFPKYFDYSKIQKKYGIKTEQIFAFDGFKEDIYIADYSPNPNFLDQLPFKEFITIRPENLKASYVPKDSVTIVPELFEKLKAYNILYLPRYEEEKGYAKGYDNIYFPPHPLHGLDVCYYTKCMLTGAGTFAREAALLGTPAVSFFPGKVFLSVDEVMIAKGWEFKSRDVNAIADYVNHAVKEKRESTSKQVLAEVLQIIDNIIKK
jgi:predicted glycosyltransferase